MIDTNDKTIQAYDHGSAEYSAATSQDLSQSIEAWLDIAVDHLPQASKILEIGSGTGKDAHYLESMGYSVERSDAAPAFVAQLQRHYPTTRTLNILTEPIATVYDLILANAVLLYFSPAQCQTILGKLHGALTPHGRLALTLNGEKVINRKLGLPRYFCYWQADPIRNLLVTSGYTDIAITVVPDNRQNKPDWLLIHANKANKDVHED